MTAKGKKMTGTKSKNDMCVYVDNYVELVDFLEKVL